MVSSSRIEWTHSTWNPVTGCTKISSGCQHCYAERMAMRLKAMGSPNYRNGFQIQTHPHMLEAPLRMRRPRMIFVDSMSDLFHEEVPCDFIQDVFAVIAQATWHRFQVLTKRAERLLQLSENLSWPRNLWMGVTVEAQEYQHRIQCLRSTRAAVKFLSLEPLLTPIPALDLSGIDWVIVGGESGPGARPMAPEWVRDVRDQCREANVQFFFKQWGGVFKKRNGRVLDGRTWEELPEPALPEHVAAPSPPPMLTQQSITHIIPRGC